MNKEWNPTMYRCRSCGDVFYSKYPRQFASCSCGNFIDETEHYCRMGGKFEDFENLGKLYFNKEE